MKPGGDALLEALALLPHGPEFRFLDRLTRLDPGIEGEGEYRVRGDEPFLRGHFPGAPIFPGVLLVEAAAQLAGVVAQSDPGLPPLPDLKLTALRSVKIAGSARPGQVLRIQARVAGRLGKLVQARAEVFADEHLVLSGDLTLSGSVPDPGQR
jgi:3-hydroxyacyl-[acyl-carrier-protein] dehydratase